MHLTQRRLLVHLAITLGVTGVFLLSGLHAASPEYSGKAKVENVGDIVFPPGKWRLEMSRRETSSEAEKQKREYFVFRRSDAVAERLTVVRYNPVIAELPAEIMYGEDYLFGNGLPKERQRDGEATGEFRKRVDVKHSESHVESSFVTAYPKQGEVWMCHINVESLSGWTFLVVHASTAVLDPLVLMNVTNSSKFMTPLPNGLTLIPPNLTGTWTYGDDVLYLGANGICLTVSTGGLSGLTASTNGKYDAPSHTFTLAGGYRYLFDEAKLTLTPARGQKHPPASGMGHTMKKISSNLPSYMPKE